MLRKMTQATHRSVALLLAGIALTFLFTGTLPAEAKSQAIALPPDREHPNGSVLRLNRKNMATRGNQNPSLKLQKGMDLLGPQRQVSKLQNMKGEYRP
jgi:hypothetical protein